MDDDVLSENERLRAAIAQQRQVIFWQWHVIASLLMAISHLHSDMMRGRMYLTRALSKLRDWEYFVRGWGEEVWPGDEDRSVISRADMQGDNSNYANDKLRRFFNRFLALAALKAHKAPSRFRLED